MSNSPDPDGERCYDGFPTRDVAIEFARRWVRDSVEELREPGQTAEQLRRLWFTFGEDAMTEGYRGSEHLDEFIADPATAEQRDWRAILDSLDAN